MKNYYFIIFTLIIFINGCALKPVEANRFQDISKYKYAIVGHTVPLSSSTGGVYSSPYSYGYGYSISKSINPQDVISGILMNKGYIIIDNPNKPEETMLVKYGQGATRLVGGGLTGYTQEVTIQILDYTTNEPIFICKAEGMGSTEADDIREAITRCLESL